MSIHGPDDNRTSFHPLPEECKDAAAVNIKSREDLNTVIVGGAALEDLANSSEENCRFCPYMVGCDLFLNAFSEDWNRYSKSVCVVVHEWNSGNLQAYVGLVATRGNTDLDSASGRILGISEGLEVTKGDNISVVDAMPTLYSNNFQATWDTLIWRWT